MALDQRVDRLEPALAELAEAQYHGIAVTILERRFFLLDGEELEIDLYGEGVRHGHAVAVVGEVRRRIYGRDVKSAAATAQKLASSTRPPGRPPSAPAPS